MMISRSADFYTPITDLSSTTRAGSSTVCVADTHLVPWDEFAGRVGAVCAALDERREARWLIAAKDALEFCVLLLGVVCSGKRAVVAPNLGAGTLLDLRDDYDLVIGSGGANGIDPATFPATAWRRSAIDQDVPCLDLFTSGSTARPKRIPKSLRQVEAEVKTLELCWGNTVAGTTFVSTVPHHHIYGMLFRLLWPLCTARPFDSALHSDPSTLRQAIEAYGSVTLVSSPAHLSRLPELIDLARVQPRLRHVFSSGAPLMPAVAKRFQTITGEAPTEVYGSTETGGIGWRRWSDSDDPTLWTPLPGIRLQIEDEHQPRLLSPFLATPEGVYLDDAIELAPDGRFRLGARLDRIVKVEGKRVSLPQIEAHLRSHPSVAEAATVLVQGTREEVCAAVVLRTQEGTVRPNERYALVQDLRTFLRTWHDPVTLPKRWRFVDALPVNERGKVSAVDIQALFDAPTPKYLPEIRRVRTGPGRFEFDLHVSDDLSCFQGHFPSFPVLPGVVQVDWAIRLGRKHLGIAGDFESLQNLRFQSLVRPGREMSLVLETNEDSTRLQFSYALGGQICSSGRIVFRK